MHAEEAAEAALLAEAEATLERLSREAKARAEAIATEDRLWRQTAAAARRGQESEAAARAEAGARLIRRGLRQSGHN